MTADLYGYLEILGIEAVGSYIRSVGSAWNDIEEAEEERERDGAAVEEIRGAWCLGLPPGA